MKACLKRCPIAVQGSLHCCFFLCYHLVLQVAVAAYYWRPKYVCNIIMKPEERMSLVKENRLYFNCLAHHKVVFQNSGAESV